MKLHGIKNNRETGKARPGAGGWVYPALLVVTVIVLSHLSGRLIPADYPATLELCMLTTPYGLTRNLLFNAHPEWMTVYRHVTIQHGFPQNGWMTLVYCFQLAFALLWLRL